MAGQVTFETAKGLLESLNVITGLPVYITEFDISSTDDETQLKLYQQYMPLFRETSYVKGVTIWGWIYGSTWAQSPYSGLVKRWQIAPRDDLPHGLPRSSRTVATLTRARSVRPKW